MLLKFLFFCFICYILFRVLNFVFRIGRVVSTQKQAFEQMQNQARQAQRQAQRQRVGDDVFIDHMPPKSKQSTSANSGAGEYVDYEEVKE